MFIVASSMERGAANDPLPLSGRRIKALTAAATRELRWGRPLIDAEIDRWSQHAQRIPDDTIRDDALRSFSSKRGHIAGAALFSILPEQRSDDLLRVLIPFEIIADFLDDVHERHPTAANGFGLHQALVDAMSPGAPLGDYYAHHPSGEDAGYLAALVTSCQRQCEALPSFALVQPTLVREASRARQTLTLNHLPDPEERDRALRDWAEEEFSGQTQWRWFELSAAASGQLAMFALLALAAKPRLDSGEIDETYEAYWPLMPLVTAMLDSFVDQVEDAANGKHRYLSHYDESERPIERVAQLIDLAARRLDRLPDGQRHTVILAGLVSFYLAKESARAPAIRAQSKQLLHAGGSLSRALLPVLRVWRTAYAQRWA